MIYVSTSCVHNDYIKDSVRELAEMGFFNIELSGGTIYYEGCIEDLLSLKQEYMLNYQVHNYFPPPPPGEDFVLNLIATDEGNYLRSTEMIRLAIDISKTLGVTSYSFHPGYTVDIGPLKKGAYFDYEGVEDQDKGAMEELFYKRFEMLLESLPQGHLPVGIENLFPFNAGEDYSLFSRPEEIIKLLERYGDNPNVGLLLDLGHLNVASYYLGFDKLEFVERLFRDFSHKLFSVHLSENDGTEDQHRGTMGESWQVSVIEENCDLLKGIPVTVEWRNLVDCKEMVTRLQSLIVHTN